jgi:DNA repair and recombination protein RAD52
MRPSNGAAANGHNLPPQPQTPNNGLTRSTSGAGPGMQIRPPQAPQEAGPLARPNPAQPVVAGRVLNQPSRMATGSPSAPASPARMNKSQEDEANDLGMPPPGAGFFSARAAANLPEGPITDPLPPSAVQNLPVFNPKLESPSIRKTPGIDHKGSRPISRDLKQLPGSSQASAAGAARPNILNPQMDATRRIGAPGSSSPMANRGQYKPPTMKRPVDAGGGPGRVPLVDLLTNGAIGTTTVDVGGDAKRQRMNN